MEIRNLSFAFKEETSLKEKRIFDHLSMAIPLIDEKGKSRIVAISAPSGWGKTTLFRLIAGLEKPETGEIEAPKAAFLFQENRLLEHLNCLKQIEVVLPKERRETAKDYLAMVGLREEALHRVDALSGGMQRRLSLARAMAFAKETRKGLLILDEPFTGVDAERSKEIMEAIRKLDIPVLMAAHETTSLELADEVIYL